MSKITNDGLARSGTRQLHPYGKSGRQRVKSLPLRPPVGPVYTLTYIIHSAHNETEKCNEKLSDKRCIADTMSLPEFKSWEAVYFKWPSRCWCAETDYAKSIKLLEILNITSKCVELQNDLQCVKWDCKPYSVIQWKAEAGQQILSSEIVINRFEGLQIPGKLSLEDVELEDIDWIWMRYESDDRWMAYLNRTCPQTNKNQMMTVNWSTC